MERARRAGWLILSLALAACSGTKGDGNKDSGTAGAPAANAGTTASTSRLCSLYTPAEIRDILGAAVGDGKPAGPMDSACQWDGTNAAVDGVYAQVQLINDPQYWEKHSGAKGYEVLKGIGKEAFVAMSLGGWEAGTVTDKSVVFVTLSGGTASRDSAVAFLRRTLEKLGAST